jgi:hypothetical protein
MSALGLLPSFSVWLCPHLMCNRLNVHKNSLRRYGYIYVTNDEREVMICHSNVWEFGDPKDFETQSV